MSWKQPFRACSTRNGPTIGARQTRILSGIAPGNAARYEPYVRALEGVDPKRLAATYFRLYPLFQQAYVELGYPNGYFNDRVVEVIDHLLDAPDAEVPVALAVPHVLYEYADPDLEGLSAGRKLMMRMGTRNESRVKARLRAIRAELLGLNFEVQAVGVFDDGGDDAFIRGSISPSINVVAGGPGLRGPE